MIFTVSSLEKIFPEKTPKLKQKSFSVFQNEKFNFQIAVFPEKELCGVAIRAESSLACGIQIRAVEMMPSVLAMKKGEGDKFVINRRKSSGVYPDLLRPMHEFEILRKKIWSAYWVTADLGEKNAAPGNYNIEFYTEEGYCEFRKYTPSGAVLKNFAGITDYEIFSINSEKGSVNEEFYIGFHKSEVSRVDFKLFCVGPNGFGQW